MACAAMTSGDQPVGYRPCKRGRADRTFARWHPAYPLVFRDPDAASEAASALAADGTCNGRRAGSRCFGAKVPAQPAVRLEN